MTGEPLLAKFMLDFNSDVSLKEQKEAGMKYLRKHCQGIIETAKVERQVRMEHARDAYLEEARLREQEELQRRKEVDQRLAMREEERRLAEEDLRREEEEEEVRLNDWSGALSRNLLMFCSLHIDTGGVASRGREGGSNCRCEE